MAKQLSNTASDGTVLWQATDKGGFFGLSTPVVQYSGAVLVTSATPTVTAFGFTSAQAGDLINSVRFMYSALVGMNLVK